jgi:catechol 2,3-dioxygenase-like lactoylglutathione lyase family enzyme
VLDTAALMAFVATANAARARDFYKQALGLRLLSEDPFALVFEANGVTLRVQKVQQMKPAPYTALGWLVSDIRSAIAELVARRVTFERFDGLTQDDLGIWKSPSGARVAWFKDPDGNLLSLTQH